MIVGGAGPVSIGGRQLRRPNVAELRRARILAELRRHHARGEGTVRPISAHITDHVQAALVLENRNLIAVVPGVLLLAPTS